MRPSGAVIVISTLPNLSAAIYDSNIKEYSGSCLTEKYWCCTIFTARLLQEETLKLVFERC